MIVETALPGFEGEWLEPIDVEEYLEGKGILARSPELTTVAAFDYSRDRPAG